MFIKILQNYSKHMIIVIFAFLGQKCVFFFLTKTVSFLKTTLLLKKQE